MQSCESDLVRSKLESFLNRVKGQLIVSCQALEDEPFYGPQEMARMALAAKQGGAAALRVNTPEDIMSVRSAVDLPIIGLYKITSFNSDVYITPTFEAAKQVAAAGADVVALDGTLRLRPNGESLEQLIKGVHEELNLPVMADVSTLQEGIDAARLGADLVGTTLAGYVPGSNQDLDGPDYQLLEGLIRVLSVPVIAEGRVHSPEEAVKAFNLGATAVVVGGAITRPQEITARFARAIRARQARRSKQYLGVDIGGTNTKLGIVSGTGHVISTTRHYTQAHLGGERLLCNLKTWISECLLHHKVEAIGIGSPGSVDCNTGTILWASDNLPGWTGTMLGCELRKAFGLPVSVENDANAYALGEHWVGAGKGFTDLLCITLGTGVGGGVISGGCIVRGERGYAGEIGHMCMDINGPECNCGANGCLEEYVSNRGLVNRARQALVDGLQSSLAGVPQLDAKAIFDAASMGDEVAISLTSNAARYLGVAIATLANILNPQCVVIGGGISRAGDMFLENVRRECISRGLPIATERLQIVTAKHPDIAGILGAARAAMDSVEREL